MKNITRPIKAFELPKFFGVGVQNAIAFNGTTGEKLFDSYQFESSHSNINLPESTINLWIKCNKKWTTDNIQWNSFEVEDKVKETGKVYLQVIKYENNIISYLPFTSKEAIPDTFQYAVPLALLEIDWEEGQVL